MTIFEEIAIRTPLNQTAGRVTSQKGCSDGDISLKEEYGNALKALRQIEFELSTISKKHPKRDALINRKLEIIERRKEIKKIDPTVTHRRAREWNNFFIDELLKLTTDEQKLIARNNADAEYARHNLRK